jgi:cobalt/nickel transport protein
MNTKKLWIGLAILILLSPLGLIIPSIFGSGTAWGEWSKEEIKQMVGFVPRGMNKISGLWKAPIPNYTFKGQKSENPAKSSISYIISAIIGVVVIVAVTLLYGKIISKRE